MSQLRSAATLAEEFASPLLLAHVVTPVAVRSEWRSYVEGVEEDCTTRARAQLDALAAALPKTVQPEVVVKVGRPAEEIAGLADGRGAGLVVMGLIGQHRAFAPRPGSIAYRVLCLTRVPVLVVPPRSDA